MNYSKAIFDRMLEVYADLTYPFEKDFFRNELWDKARNVIDLGCGNCRYGSLLASDFPEKKFTCVDRDKTMIDIAQRLYMDRNMTFLTDSLNNLDPVKDNDFLFSRLTIRHVDNWQELFVKMRNVLLPGAGIMIIDADIENINFGDDLTNFNSIFQNMLEKSSRISLCRLEEKLINEFTKAGFEYLRTDRVILDSCISGVKEQIYEYMSLVMRMAYYPFVPRDIQGELDNWLEKGRSNVKIGSFACTFCT